MDRKEHDTQHPLTLNPVGLVTPAGHYSHVAVANGMVFVSGQLPIDEQGRKLTDASFETQAEQVLANLKAALCGAGSRIAHLVHVRIYIVDIDYWARFDRIYARWAADVRPARAVVPVPALHFGLKIEAEAIALL